MQVHRFDYDFARNVIIFGVDNSWSSHCENLKNNFLCSMNVQLMVIIEALYHPKKSLVLILLKQTRNFVFSLHYNTNNNYLYVNGK